MGSPLYTTIVDSHRTTMDSHSQQCMLGMHVKESAIFVKAFLIDITNVLKEIVFYKYYMVAAAL